MWLNLWVSVKIDSIRWRNEYNSKWVQNAKAGMCSKYAIYWEHQNMYLKLNFARKWLALFTLTYIRPRLSNSVVCYQVENDAAHELLCDFVFVWGVSDKSFIRILMENGHRLNELKSIQQRRVCSVEYSHHQNTGFSCFSSQIFVFNWSYFWHSFHRNEN